MENKSPFGVTTEPSGNFCVCYPDACKRVVLTRDLAEENTLLSLQDGLREQPLAIAWTFDHLLCYLQKC